MGKHARRRQEGMTIRKNPSLSRINLSRSLSLALHFFRASCSCTAQHRLCHTSSDYCTFLQPSRQTVKSWGVGRMGHWLLRTN